MLNIYYSYDGDGGYVAQKADGTIFSIQNEIDAFIKAEDRNPSPSEKWAIALVKSVNF